MSGTQPNAKRLRPMGTITMSPVAWAMLEDLAKQNGKTRSAVVEELVRKASARKRRV